ncbi:MAG TPA: PQQ-binding-like beta-propeller repeat protein, partial [Gemmataceae bacterium]|nr:PQQ-binding-like beta-propeller repeat protein [Gemmataceae bacterium]
MPRSLCRILFLCISLCLGASVVSAADAPQWRGPNRDGVFKDTGLLKAWPKAGPRLLWTYKDAGVGYSSEAVVGDRLYTMGARGKDEFVFCLDASDPKAVKQLWAVKVGPLFTFSGNKWGDGPRSTPTVHDGLVYALGGAGNLVCLDARDGALKWQKDMLKDLDGDPSQNGGGWWGYSWSPLVDGEQVICVPGGKKGAVAALDRKSGKVLWRSKELTDPAVYSSPIGAAVGGRKQYVQLTDNGIAGVAAKDGSLLWFYKQKYADVVIPTPLFHDGYVYAAAGGNVCDLLKLTASGDGVKAAKVYSNKNMKTLVNGVVRVDGGIFGHSDRRGWVCQDFVKGKIVWEEENVLGPGSASYADGRLYCFGEDEGVVVLAEANKEGWKEHGRFTIPEKSKLRKPGGRMWTPPVIANGRLYLRDQDLIFCFDISGK